MGFQGDHQDHRNGDSHFTPHELLYNVEAWNLKVAQRNQLIVEFEMSGLRKIENVMRKDRIWNDGWNLKRTLNRGGSNKTFVQFRADEHSIRAIALYTHGRGNSRRLKK